LTLPLIIIYYSEVDNLSLIFFSIVVKFLGCEVDGEGYGRYSDEANFTYGL
jgi:hypothetical protein